MVRYSTAKHMGAPINKSSQSARQVVGAYIFKVIGETRMNLIRGHHKISLPDDQSLADSTYALEPRHDIPTTNYIKIHQLWPHPDKVTTVGGKLRIPNLTPKPQVLKRHQHFCQYLFHMMEMMNLKSVYKRRIMHPLSILTCLTRPKWLLLPGTRA